MLDQSNITSDIQTPWLNIIRRLQSVAKSKGLSVLTIKVLVDAEGIPVFWSSPDKIKIEPKGSVDEIVRVLKALEEKGSIEEILRLLSK